jgi:hypothetical protein
MPTVVAFTLPTGTRHAKLDKVGSIGFVALRVTTDLTGDAARALPLLQCRPQSLLPRRRSVASPDTRTFRPLLTVGYATRPESFAHGGTPCASTIRSDATAPCSVHTPVVTSHDGRGSLPFNALEVSQPGAPSSPISWFKNLPSLRLTWRDRCLVGSVCRSNGS